MGRRGTSGSGNSRKDTEPFACYEQTYSPRCPRFHRIRTGSSKPDWDTTYLKDLGQAYGETLSLPAIAVEAAYGLPKVTNFEILFDLARSRTEAARHHVWDLRQDPGYFSEVVNELGSVAATHSVEDFGSQRPG